MRAAEGFTATSTQWPPSEKDLERARWEGHARGAEASRLRGHVAIAASRKRERQNRRNGRKR